MSKADEIRSKLEAALAPSELDVVDDSESHRGHGGYQEGGESHYNLRIRSDVLQARPASHATAWCTARSGLS